MHLDPREYTHATVGPLTYLLAVRSMTDPHLDRPRVTDAAKLRRALETIRAMAKDMGSGGLSHDVMREWARRIVDGCNASLTD